MQVQDATLEAVEEACNDRDLGLAMNNKHTQMWLGAIRIAETRDADEIMDTVGERHAEMRDEEVVTHKLAAVLDDVFTFGDELPDGTFVFHGPH